MNLFEVPHSIISFYLPSLFRQPQVGDRYTLDEINPFEKPFCYTVKEIKDGWALCQIGDTESTDARPVRNLISFYRLVS